MNEKDIGHHLHDISALISNVSHYNYTSKEELFFDELLKNAEIGIASVYIIVCFVGVLGNGMTLCLLRAKCTLDITDIYICNLAVSDMSTLLTLPLLATDMLSRNIWPFGWFVCKVMASTAYISICASVYIIACMTIDRFESVLLAVKMVGKRTKFRAKLILSIAWLIAFIYMLPTVYFATLKDKRCTLQYSSIGSMSINTVQLVHTVFRFAIAFLVPLAVLLICNISITAFLMVKDRKKKRNKRNTVRKAKTQMPSKKVTKMVMTVTVLFFLCWIPNLFATTIHLLGPEVLQVTDYLFDPHYETIFHWCTVCCIYLNAGLNPILYCFLSGNYKAKASSSLVESGTSVHMTNLLIPLKSSDSAKEITICR